MRVPAPSSTAAPSPSAPPSSSSPLALPPPSRDAAAAALAARRLLVRALVCLTRVCMSAEHNNDANIRGRSFPPSTCRHHK